MTIDILTLFPEMFTEVFKTSIIGRAQKETIVKINVHNLRAWTQDKRRTVDDTPYGGGPGMVLKVEVIDRALHALKARSSKLEARNKSKLLNYENSKQVSDFGFRASDFQNHSYPVILLTPKGKAFTQQIAQRLSKKKGMILVCGHYEGFDERVRKLVDEEISIGNYILTGGEIPAMVIADAVTRLIPSVINAESLEYESFSQSKSYKLKAKSYLEYPQYTRPEIYRPVSIKTKRFLSVPKILLSGNHSKIATWRKEKRKIIKE